MGSNALDSNGVVQQHSRMNRRTWLRWMPAAAAPVVIAVGALAGSLPARAGDPLPPKTPAQVLELAGTHQVQAFSGTLEQVADLGLPELPAAGKTAAPSSAGSTASMIELLSGQHTARLYVDGKDNTRVQVVDQLAERDLIRHGSDVWFYSSKDNTVQHVALPAETHDPSTKDAQGAPGLPAPADMAQQFLSSVDPTTSVTVGPDVVVAGRTAYNLLIEPRTDATLVGKVAIAVDGLTGMPLSVQVTARGADKPAFTSGFTALTLDTPDQSLFSFTPPPGSTVKDVPVPDKPHKPANAPAPQPMTSPDQILPLLEAKAHVSVAGTGWETVVGTAAGASGSAAASLLSDPLLSQAAVPVPGGKLLSTALLNVLVTDDGRMFAGMVPPEKLQAAAAAAR